ncbi:MAG: hypothetical protein Q9196_004631 [Gyalolechia fulgens]
MALVQASCPRLSSVCAALQDFDLIPDLFPCLVVTILYFACAWVFTLLAPATNTTGAPRRRLRAASKRVAFEPIQAVPPTTTIIGNIVTNCSDPIIILIDHSITCSSTPIMVMSWNMLVIFSIPQSIGRADAGIFVSNAGNIGRGNPISPPMAEATQADAGNGGNTSTSGTALSSIPESPPSWDEYRDTANRYEAKMHPFRHECIADSTWKSSPRSVPSNEVPDTAPPSDEAREITVPMDDAPEAMAPADEAPKKSAPSDDDYLAEAANIPLPSSKARPAKEPKDTPAGVSEGSSKAEPEPAADASAPIPQLSVSAGAAPSNPEDGAKAADTQRPSTPAAHAPAKEEPSHPVPQADLHPAPKPSLTVEPPTVGPIDWEKIYGCDPFDQPLPPTPASESGSREEDKFPPVPQPEIPSAPLSPPCTPMDCEPDIAGEVVAFPFPPFPPPLSSFPSPHVDEEGDITLPDVDDCGNPPSAPWPASDDEDTEMSDSWSSSDDEDTEMTDPWLSSDDEDTEMSATWSSSDDEDTEMSDAPSDFADEDTVMTDYSSDNPSF